MVTGATQHAAEWADGRQAAPTPACRHGAPGQTTYYAAMAPADADGDVLDGETTADVCIVGAGLTGLSAALALAQAGARVAVLEAGPVGAGASARSGGQLIPGLHIGATDMLARFGRERSRALVDLTLHALDRTRQLAATQDVGLVETGHITAAWRPRHMAALAREALCLQRDFDRPTVTLLDRDALRAHVGIARYHGGLRDGAGGHIDPLRYLSALAAAATRAGATLFRHSAALDVAPGPAARVRTARGSVRAGHVVLACDGSPSGPTLDGAPSPFRRRLMPVLSHIAATAPLGAERAAALLPRNEAVSDTRFALNYFRLAPDTRLLFGGGERYTLRPAADCAAIVRRALATVLPDLAAIRLDFAWSGLVPVTTSRLPHLAHHAGLWVAQGYSGQGMLLAQAAGHAIARAILGDATEFDLLALLPGRDWPGGSWLRHPLYTGGMLWFALRDRA